MKKLFLLLIVAAIVFVMYNRQRMFIRDPLGSVQHDGMKEEGAQVFINYNNDVLVENDNAPMYVRVIEHGLPVGTPKGLNCIHYVVCMTDADTPTLAGAADNVTVESMTNKVVLMRDNGRETTISLR